MAVVIAPISACGHGTKRLGMRPYTISNTTADNEADPAKLNHSSIQRHLPVNGELRPLVSDKPNPNSKGPRVNTVQYNNICRANGRDFFTRQMALKVRSMVNIKLMAVSASMAKPAAVNLPALSLNCRI